jgi:hypothetical protein
MLFFPLRYKAPFAFPQMFSLFFYSYTILSDSLSLSLSLFGFKGLNSARKKYLALTLRISNQTVTEFVRFQGKTIQIFIIPTTWSDVIFILLDDIADYMLVLSLYPSL